MSIYGWPSDSFKLGITTSRLERLAEAGWHDVMLLPVNCHAGDATVAVRGQVYSEASCMQTQMFHADISICTAKLPGLNCRLATLHSAHSALYNEALTLAVLHGS